MGRAEGVYFLANDVVHDWAVAFLNSLRAFNPALRVVLIPFDDRADRVRGLAARHRVEVFEDDGTFARLEGIGRRLELGITRTGPHWFRRFAAFWGPLDDFLYLDARTLVLADLTPLVRLPREFGYDLAYYDLALDQVYNPGALRTRLVVEHGARGFTSNIWAARKGLFDIAGLERAAAELAPHRADLNPRNTDQFFLNYLTVAGRLKTVGFPDLIPGLVSRCWSRGLAVYRAADGFRSWDHGGWEHDRRVAVLNWAGIRLSPAMPNDALHYRFRAADRSPLARAAGGLARRVAAVPLRLVDAARRDRRVNTLYHRLRGRAGG